jgi:uncharacterized protein YndB with AHSA1/START domain
MEEKNDLSKRVLTIKRTLNVPIKLVWEAWTKAKHIAQWWGPISMELNIIEHDFRVGGKWKYVMMMPDGKEFITDGEYSDIVVFKKIITSANFKPMTEGVEIRAFFEAHDDKTLFTFSVVHPTEEYKIQQEKMGFYNGWGSTFNRLEDFLNALNERL